MRPVISKPIEYYIRAIRFGNGDSGSMGICQCLTLSKTLNRVFRVKCHPVADVPNETTFLTKLCHFLQYFPLVIDTFTYGIYSALFVQSTQVLLTRRRVNYKLYLVCLSTLFLLSTIHIVAAYAWAFITDTATTGIYEVLARYALANALADAILIHRCYIIWGYSWRAVAFPIVAYLLNIVGVIIGALPLVGPSERIAISVCIGTTFFTNVVASSLAAGRIWWISRRASCVLSRGARRRYSNLTAILLESGLIYPASIIVVIGMFVGA
ncbi:hypothetical protein C8F01DRAFT_1259959 [Mycena amicta]|nr:hypothetical protein C8F01DRAFT_1259959 [Mycena amicta]